MKLLLFGAKRFHYTAFEKTVEAAPDSDADEVVTDALVVYIHAEQLDEEAARGRLLTKVVKNCKWAANKQGLRNVVLHSFTHLGGISSSPEFAQQFIADLAQRLRDTDYRVWTTPFGYLCEWDLSVRGESIGRVFKQI
jgi:hypothetical protein